MSRIALVCCSLAVTLIVDSPTSAGTYHGVDRRTRAVASTDPSWVGPYAIVHPPGYDNTQAELRLRVCLRQGADVLVGPLHAAMKVWNELQPLTPNCDNCWVAFEPTTMPPVPRDAVSALVHELGHCAMGLGHINLQESTDSPMYFRTGICDANDDGICGQTTSLTASANAPTIIVPLGNAPGDRMNVHENNCPSIPLLDAAPQRLLEAVMRRVLNYCEGEECLVDGLPDPLSIRRAGELWWTPAEPETCTRTLGVVVCPTPAQCCPACPGPQCPIAPMDVADIAWFRKADNHPFITGSEVDTDTYSRSALNLPIPSAYAASANRLVGEDLNFFDSQSVMYSTFDSDTVFYGLSPDDVNMVRMGMSGANRQQEPAPSDDYRVRLVYTSECSTADVDVGFAPLPSGVTGACLADLDVSFTQGAIRVHHSLVPVFPYDTPTVDLSSSVVFDYGDAIFFGDYESGDLSAWSLVVIDP